MRLKYRQRRSLVDGGGGAKPRQIDILRSRIIVPMIIGRARGDRPGILPPMMLDVAVGKGYHTSPVVRTAREIEEAIA